MYFYFKKLFYLAIFCVVFIGVLRIFFKFKSLDKIILIIVQRYLHVLLFRDLTLLPKAILLNF